MLPKHMSLGSDEKIEKTKNKKPLTLSESSQLIMMAKFN